MIDTLKLKKNSDTVFIIGGGPSILKYLPDTSVLLGKDIICTNNAYLLYPEAMILFFMDKYWFNNHEKKIKEVFQGTTVTCDNTQKKFFLENGVEHVFLRGENRGLSSALDKLNGCNSGHMSINLAALMGYKKIVLLGFDMNVQVEKSHYHDGHPRETKKDRYTTHFLPGMKSIAPLQEQFVIKIYNINRESAIRDFEFADLEQFL